jgi:hypothetical protein
LDLLLERDYGLLGRPLAGWAIEHLEPRIHPGCGADITHIA